MDGITLSCDGNKATFDFGDGVTWEVEIYDDAGTERIRHRLVGTADSPTVVYVTHAGGSFEVKDVVHNTQILP